jgi:hypothetical protein
MAVGDERGDLGMGMWSEDGLVWKKSGAVVDVTIRLSAWGHLTAS